jgi:ribonuclease HI
MKLTIFTDGGSRGNPGPAGIGAIIYNDKKETVATVSKFLGVTTNNQAEYRAIIAALHKAKELGGTELDFFMDSELAVKQINREYKVKNKDLAPLFLEINNLSLSFKKLTFTHVRREYNKEADRLANEAMDKGY